MNRIMTILLVLLASFSSSYAADAAPCFSNLSAREGFDYTYVSPAMLKMMGDKVVNTDLGIRASDVISIETVSTIGEGTDTELWALIRGLKKKMKLETLSTKKSDNYRYDVLGKLSGNRKYISKLMVITQDTGANVTVVYIEGQIPIQDLMLQF